MKCEDCTEYASEFCRDCLKEQRQEAELAEIQKNWRHKTQKYHTIKHPDGSHWGVFDHSVYGTDGYEIRKIRNSEGKSLRASDSRKQSAVGYRSGMGSPSDAAKEWVKKHGGKITNHKIKEEVEEEVVANTTAGVAFPPTAKFKLKRRKEPRVQQIIVQDRRYKVEKHGKPILRKSFAQYMKDKDNG